MGRGPALRYDPIYKQKPQVIAMCPSADVRTRSYDLLLHRRSILGLGLRPGHCGVAARPWIRWIVAAKLISVESTVSVHPPSGISSFQALPV